MKATKQPDKNFIPRVWAPDKSQVTLVVAAGFPATDANSLGANSVKAVTASASQPNSETPAFTAATPLVTSPLETPAWAAFSGDYAECSMVPTAEGWWESPLPLTQGSRYGFRLDGGEVRPDPRSRFQPEGVHTWSQIWLPSRLDHGSWQGLDCRGKVFYELHVGTFTPEGTFASAAARLPYLRKLGVEVVEIMPVTAFEGKRGWGYDPVLLFATQASYGGPEGLARFVAAAHREGLAVCLDTVLNHLGNLGCYLGEYGPYYSPNPTIWGQGFNLGTDSSSAADSTEVLCYLRDCVLWWLEAFGIDALRLDAIHAIPEPGRGKLLREISRATTRLTAESGWKRTLVAESDLNDASLLEDLGLQCLWNDDFHHALHCLFTGESGGYYQDFATRDALVKVLQDTYFHNGTFSSFRNQTWGAPVPKEVPSTSFVVFASNHDQVGNRPFGDRPASYLSDYSAAAMLAITLLSPYTPMLFMGEEYGATTPFQFFADPIEPTDADRIRQGRLAEFTTIWEQNDASKSVKIPDPTAFSTFCDSKLDWIQAQSSRGKSFQRWVCDLIALRSRQFMSGLSQTDAQASWNDNCLHIKTIGLELLVNFANEPLPVPDSALLNVSDYFQQIPSNHPGTAPQVKQFFVI